MRRSVHFFFKDASTTEINKGDVDAALDEMLFTGGALNATLLGAGEAAQQRR